MTARPLVGLRPSFLPLVLSLPTHELFICALMSRHWDQFNSFFAVVAVVSQVTRPVVVVEFPIFSPQISQLKRQIVLSFQILKRYPPPPNAACEALCSHNANSYPVNPRTPSASLRCRINLGFFRNFYKSCANFFLVSHVTDTLLLTVKPVPWVNCERESLPRLGLTMQLPVVLGIRMRMDWVHKRNIVVVPVPGVAAISFNWQTFVHRC